MASELDYIKRRLFGLPFPTTFRSFAFSSVFRKPDITIAAWRQIEGGRHLSEIGEVYSGDALLITILAFAQALALSPPEPRGDPADWVPPAYLQSVTDSEGRTVFDLMIDINGAPVSCVTTQPSGVAGLDRAVCVALIKNGRFRPASDENGRALPGVWSDNIHWKPHKTGETRYSLPPADLHVEMAADVAPPNRVTVQTFSIVRPDSSIALCAVSKASHFDRLNAKACEVVVGLGKLPPVRDASGAAVTGVRAITIMFSGKEKKGRGRMPTR
jgi:hypothetical protein